MQRQGRKKKQIITIVLSWPGSWLPPQAIYIVPLSCFCNTETHTRWEKLTECPQAHRSQTNWNQKVDDGNYPLHHHQPIRKMCTPASLPSQGPTHWLHGLCGDSSESWSVASPRLLRKAALLGFPHTKTRPPCRPSQPRPGPPDLRPLASAFQPQLPSKCLFCPLLHPKYSRPQTWGGRLTLLVKVLPLLSSQACRPGMAGLLQASTHRGPDIPSSPPPSPPPSPSSSTPTSALPLSFACSTNPGRWQVETPGFGCLWGQNTQWKQFQPHPPKKGDCPQVDHTFPEPLI